MRDAGIRDVWVGGGLEFFWGFDLGDFFGGGDGFWLEGFTIVYGRISIAKHVM